MVSDAVKRLRTATTNAAKKGPETISVQWRDVHDLLIELDASQSLLAALAVNAAAVIDRITGKQEVPQ